MILIVLTRASDNVVDRHGSYRPRLRICNLQSLAVFPFRDTLKKALAECG